MRLHKNLLKLFVMRKMELKSDYSVCFCVVATWVTHLTSMEFATFWYNVLIQTQWNLVNLSFNMSRFFLFSSFNWSFIDWLRYGALTVPVYERRPEMNSFLFFLVLCRLLVGAPWSGYSRNRKGDVYKCPVSGSRISCDKLDLQGEVWLFIIWPLPSASSSVLTLSTHTLQNMQVCRKSADAVLCLFPVRNVPKQVNAQRETAGWSYLFIVLMWIFFHSVHLRFVLFFNPQIPSVSQVLIMLIATCPLVWLWPGDLPPLVWRYVCVCLCGEENCQEVCQCSLYDDSSWNSPILSVRATLLVSAMCVKH